MADAITDSFGDYEGFKGAFSAEAASLFGSGWTWLVADRDKLRVTSTSNADTPIREPGQTPLLVLDVWEHAYYLDHQNDRAAYIDAFLAHLANWRFAEENLERI